MAEQGRRELAPGNRIKVSVKPPPQPPPVCRGFYQVEEDSLYIALYPDGDFFSFLDSPTIKIDIDRQGSLLFIHILTPRRNWKRRRRLHPPVGLEWADIRFRAFREKIPEVKLETDSKISWLHIIFYDHAETSAYRLADNLICEVTPDSSLASIWLTEIYDDRAAREMAAWRKKMKKDFDKHRESRYIRIEIDPTSRPK